MKFKNNLAVISLSVFLLFSNTFASVSGEVKKEIKIDLTSGDKGEVGIMIGEDILRQYPYLIDAHEKIVEDNAEKIRSNREAGVRSIKIKIDDFAFDKTAFGGYNKFYLGAAADEVNSVNTLVRAELQYNNGKSEYEVKFVSLGNEKIYVNGEKDQTNPVYGKKIDNLTLANNNWPLVSVDDKTVCYFSGDREVFTNKTNLNDAADQESSGVAMLAANGSMVVAAVKPNNGDEFGKENSGFALMSRDEDGLKIYDATTGEEGNKPFKLDLDAGVLLAIDTTAQIFNGQFSDMYWDTKLNRLFVGLNGVSRVSNRSEGGAVSLLVGRIDDDKKLSFVPAVGLNQNNFKKIFASWTQEFNIVGFNACGLNKEIFTSIHKVRTMHTSTGKPYVIVNGGCDDDGLKSKANVYALPLVSENDDENNIGKISKKAGNGVFKEPVDGLATNINILHAIDRKKSWVGFGGRENQSDLFVSGDSVFISINGEPHHEDNGIFSSTALLDENGQIFAWTSWRNVMGSVDQVVGFGLDTLNGNFWYLDGDDKKTVKVTQWGKGESITATGADKKLGHSLVGLLQDQFPQETGGVHQVFDFDQFTDGFKVAIQEERVFGFFSMMIATGLDKVVLIESGKRLTDINQFFNSTKDFNEEGKIKIYDSANSPVLAEIGPICCAEVSRIGLALVADKFEDNGWLFVGGYNGVAVLSEDDNGFGWDTSQNKGLSNLTEDLDDLNFKKLGDFEHVRKLVCYNSKLYVVSDKSISYFVMNEDKFKKENPDDLDLTVVNVETITGSADDYITDFMVSGNLFIVSTTAGLFRKFINDVNWTEVKDVKGNSLGSVVGFDFLSTYLGGDTNEGNLYVLAADFAYDLAYVHRFQVVSNLFIGIQILPIKEVDDQSYFYSIGEFRGNFVTDGAFGYHLSPKHLDRTNFLRKININSNLSSFRSGDKTIDLDVDSELNYNVGKMVRNSATGAWVVPGDWGIRVQE